MTEVIELPQSRLQFVNILNPLDVRQREMSSVAFHEGQTVAQVWPAAVSEVDKFAYAVNGQVLDAGQLATTVLKNNDFVSRIPLIAGDDAKNVLRLVALIAVAIYAPDLAAYMYESFGGTYVAANAAATIGAITVGVQVAGALIVNALLPPAKPPGGAGGAGSESPTYGIDGPKNTSAEGIVVPVVYGKHRFGGNVVQNFIVNEGETQILHTLICAGEGPIGSIDKIELNDQPLESYTDAEKDYSLGGPNSLPMAWFGDTVTPRAVGQSIIETWKTFTTTGQVDRLRIDIVAPTGLFYARDDGGFDSVTVPIEIQIRKSGDVTWQSFGAVNEVQSYVLTNQWYDQPSVYNETTGVYTMAPYTPTGSEYLADNGDGTGLYYTSMAAYLSGDGAPAPVGIRTKVATYTWTSVIQMTGASRNAIRRSFLSGELEQGVYEIQYRRNSAPSSDPRTADAVTLVEVNEIVNEDVGYRNTALLAVKVKLNDQLNGMPNITFEHGGKIVQVYDETTGAWVSKPSDNPAWITWDALTNTRYAGGAPYSRLDLAKWRQWAKYCNDNKLTFNGVFDTQSNVWDAANQIARCGRAQIIMVGTRYSVVIDKADTASMMFSVANIVSGTFKETWLSMSDRANEVEVSFADKDDRYRRRTVRLYDQAAIAAGEPVRTANLQIMGIVDAERAYIEADLLLKMNRYIQRTVEFSAPIEAVACVAGDVIYVQHDMPQWGYSGRFNAGSTTTVLNLDRPVPMEAGATYRALVHYPALQRYSNTISSIVGDVIYITGYAGTVWGQLRLRHSTGTPETEVLEVVQSGANYGVRVASTVGFTNGQTVQIWQTNALVDVAINNAVGSGTVDQTSLVAPVALPQAPAEFDKWMFGKVNKIAKPFRVRQVAGSHEYRRDIIAIEYNEAIYAGPSAAVPDLDYSDLNDRLVSLPTDVAFTEKLVISGTSIVPQVTVSYRSTQAAYLNSAVLVSFSGGPWTEVGRHFNEVSFRAAEGDQLRVRFIAYDRFGNVSVSPLDTFSTYTVLGKTAPPSNVTGLVPALKPLQVQINWNLPADLDYKTTELRVGASWAAGTALVSPGPTRSADGMFVWPRPTNGTYTIWAAHIDTSGNYSATPVSASITVDNSIDAAGSPGAAAVSAVLSPESLVFPADASGNVTSYAVNTSTLSINVGGTTDTGNWTITELGKSAGITSSLTGAVVTISALTAGFESGYFDFQATRSGYGTITKRLLITKAKSGGAGANAQTLALTADAQTFTFDGVNVASPTSQTITFTANLQNISGTATFTCTRYNSSGGSLGTVTMGGTGNARTLTVAQFSDAAYAVVTATLSGLSDTMTAVRLRAGSSPVTGFLTNEAYTVPCDSAGTVLAGGLTAATGTFKVFNGLTDVTGASVTYSTVSQSNCTGSINATTGVYSVTAISGDTAALTVRAVYNPGSGNVTVDKVFSLSKSRNGSNGSNGLPGTDATVHWMTSSSGAVRKSIAGVFTPATLTFTGYSRTGVAAPAVYAGRFVIALSTDGTSYADAYTSATDESAYTYTVPANAVAIRARFYLAGGTTTLLQEIGVPVVLDGATGSSGSNGTSGNSTAVAYLYQWSATAPADPTTSTTFTWATAAHTGTPGNGWSTTISANPGTAGVGLWICSKTITATAGTASSTVTWGAGTFTKQSISANGAQGPTGSTGAAGARFAIASIYKWQTAPAPTVAGSSTYTWSNGTFTNLPATWSLTPGNSPSPGLTLWEAQIKLIDAATSSTSSIDWSTASVVAIGYAGTNGSNGSTGSQGASSRIAYAKSTSSTLNTTPTSYQTTGTASLPATNTWGGAEVWSATIPTPTAGEWVFQVNGIYDPATNFVTWGVPYVTTFRVAQLSALSANLGAVTAGSININSKAIIASDGLATFKGIRVEDEAGNVVLQTRTGSPTSLPSTWVNPASNWLNQNVGASNMLWGSQNGPWSCPPGQYGAGVAVIKNNTWNPHGLKPGDQLTLSADLWQDAASAADGQVVGMWLYFADSSSNWWGGAYIETASQTATRLSATATIPTDPAQSYTINVAFYHQPGDGTYPGTVYADRVQVERGAVATQYKPGSQPGATVGAVAGSNLTDSGGTVLGDSAVKNSALVINADGTVTNSGGGQVTVAGLGITDITYVLDGVTKTGDTLMKNTSYADYDWSGGAHSKESFPAAIAVATVPTDVNSTVCMFGLNDSPTTTSYTDINFAIYLDGGWVRIYEEGAIVYDLTFSADFGTYVAGDVFSVEYDGVTVRYAKNGVVFYARGASIPGRVFFDSAFYRQNSKLLGVRFMPVSLKNRGNLVDTSTWVHGASDSTGWKGFVAQGGTNYIAYDTVPGNVPGTVWRGYANVGSVDSTGGFYIDPNLPLYIDHTKMYRFSVWVRRFGSGGGQIYFGTTENWWNTNSQYAVEKLDGSTAAEGNPYFVSFNRDNLVSSEWYLLVGYVYPYTYSGSPNHSAAYRASNGAQVTPPFNSAMTYRWRSDARNTKANIRVFQYNTTTADAYTDFFQPRIDLCDGTEPSIESLLAMGGVDGRNPINSGNASTFIANAAIGTAQVGVLTASNLTVTALSNTVNGGAGSGGRVVIDSNKVLVYDTSNVVRVKLGYLL